MDRSWLKKYVILLAALVLFAGVVWYAAGQREDSVENAVLASAANEVSSEEEFAWKEVSLSGTEGIQKGNENYNPASRGKGRDEEAGRGEEGREEMIVAYQVVTGEVRGSISAEAAGEVRGSISAEAWEQECCLAWPGKAGRADG